MGKGLIGLWGCGCAAMALGLGSAMICTRIHGQGELRTVFLAIYMYGMATLCILIKYTTKQKVNTKIISKNFNTGDRYTVQFLRLSHLWWSNLSRMEHALQGRAQCIYGMGSMQCGAI